MGAVRKHVGVSVAWTAAVTSLAVAAWNRAFSPLTEVELVAVMTVLPIALRAVEPFAHALGAYLLRRLSPPK